jgi:hypothetical protein
MFVPLKELAKDPQYEVTWRQVGENQLDAPDTSLDTADVEGKDIIIGQRLNGWDGLKNWRMWTSPGRSTVYELDDDIWNVTYDNVDAHDFLRKNPEIAVASARYARTSNLITTTNDHLAEAIRKETLNDNVVVLPNYIPDWVLDLPNDRKDRRMRIGWCGGSSHRLDIQRIVSKPIGQFLRRCPDWDLYIGGVNFWSWFKTPEPRTFFTGWLHISNEDRLYYRSIDYDIGICPLLDTQFNRSKSHIKPLEMMARGIPVVASDVEPYRKFIDHGINGFLCKYDHEWLKYLTMLANDDGLREQMSRAAKVKAAENVISKHARKWGEAYKKAMEG